jgi:hypothetical protein
MKRAFSQPECMVCWDVPSDDIYRCNAGHLACAECMEALWQRNVRSCPMCCNGPLKQEAVHVDTRRQVYGCLVHDDLLALRAGDEPWGVMPTQMP